MTVVKIYKEVVVMLCRQADWMVASIEDVKKVCEEWMRKRAEMGERWIASCEQHDKYEVIRGLCDMHMN